MENVWAVLSDIFLVIVLIGAAVGYFIWKKRKMTRAMGGFRDSVNELRDISRNRDSASPSDTGEE